MTTVLVTRPAGAADPLVTELEARGYRVSAVPTVVTRSLTVSWPDLAAFDWVVVTSAAGVEALPAIASGPLLAAVGESTAAALRARGATVATGVFGAQMAVASVNDGPFTVLVEV